MLRRNVLIFHSGALGDFVLSWPLAMALGRLFPQSRIICVCASQKGKLFEKALRLESTDVENGWSNLFAKDGAITETVARMLSGAHTIFSFVTSTDSVWATNVRRFAPEAKLLFIDPVLTPGFSQHATVHLLNQLSSDSVISTAVAQMLRSIAERGTGAISNATGPVVIHPGAGSPAKCWPLDRFHALAVSIAKSGRAVRQIVGDVEVDRWTAADVAGASQLATLVELFDVLRGASCFIGNDSGPAHLAGILGVPTVALFGSTDPTNWKPLGPRVTAISRPTLDAISVADVLEHV